VIDRLSLDKNIGHGRIYRVVHDGYRSGKKPGMLDESPSKLVNHLDHPNGWWRDNAQKQLVILNDKSVVPVSKQIAAGKQGTLSSKPSHLARIHALWTLDGLSSTDKDVLLIAMNDEHPQVRKTAIWISEPYIKKGDTQILKKLDGLRADPDYNVRTQILLSLSVNKGEAARAVASKLIAENQDNETLTGAEAAMQRSDSIKVYGSRLGNLTPLNRNLVLKGAATYRSICASCHGADAKGLTSLIAPPLLGSKRLAGEKSTAIRILLHGLSGPLDGKSYPGDLMPAMGANSDQWMAEVLSFARFEFGRAPRTGPSPFITPDEVAKVRSESGNRTRSWTVAELEKLELEAATKVK
jgi:mono/diheme cytochrome c family protein